MGDEVEAYLTQRGYFIIREHDATRAAAAARTVRVDLVIVDREFPEREALASRLAAHPSTTRVGLLVIDQETPRAALLGAITIELRSIPRK
jgi:DNA-binding response OmpR family regulator